MSDFIVRRIGWVFDDDWYNFDGDHDIESIYNSEEEAIARMDLLNHAYFLYWADMYRRFQINYNANPQDEFVSRDKLAELISKYLEVDIASIYDPQRGFIWKDETEYLRKLTREQVKDILNKINLNFFNYYKIERDQFYLYSFKRNPTKWQPYEDEIINSEEYYNFYDDRDIVANYRLVNSKLDCYYYAINSDYRSITRKLSEEVFYEGEIKDLTNTPDLLISILEQCPNIQYDATYSYLSFSKDMTPIELMKIDSVLIHPILLIEKVPITDSILKDESKVGILKEIASKYGFTTDDN